MEMDFRYKQYGIESNAKKDDSDSTQAQKPHQEALTFFENHENVFKFEEFCKNLSTIKGEVELFLEDNTKISIATTNDLIKMAIKYPNGTHFFGTWTTIKDEEEFLKAIDK